MSLFIQALIKSSQSTDEQSTRPGGPAVSSDSGESTPTAKGGGAALLEVASNLSLAPESSNPETSEPESTDQEFTDLGSNHLARNSRLESVEAAIEDCPADLSASSELGKIPPVIPAGFRADNSSTDLDSDEPAHSIVLSERFPRRERWLAGIFYFLAVVLLFGTWVSGAYYYYLNRDAALGADLVSLTRASGEFDLTEAVSPVAGRERSEQYLRKTKAASSSSDQANSPPLSLVPIQSTDSAKEKFPALTAENASSDRTGEIKTLFRKSDQLISISKAAQAHPADSLVRLGYRAYQTGKFKTARQAYQKAIALQPNNRDALLGLAALAVRAGRSIEAKQRYQQLFDAHPEDTAAVAGLNSLEVENKGSSLETNLKLALQKNPQSPEINFTLGNLYSHEQRWAEAQAHYFNTYRNDTQNPDLLFNLAVSLENLGKIDVATKFYRLALTASESRKADFDRDLLLRRLQSVQASADGSEP